MPLSACKAVIDGHQVNLIPLGSNIHVTGSVTRGPGCSQHDPVVLFKFSDELGRESYETTNPFPLMKAGSLTVDTSIDGTKCEGSLYQIFYSPSPSGYQYTNTVIDMKNPAHEELWRRHCGSSSSNVSSLSRSSTSSFPSSSSSSSACCIPKFELVKRSWLDPSINWTSSFNVSNNRENGTQGACYTRSQRGFRRCTYDIPATPFELKAEFVDTNNCPNYDCKVKGRWSASNLGKEGTAENPNNGNSITFSGDVGPVVCDVSEMNGVVASREEEELYECWVGDFKEEVIKTHRGSYPRVCLKGEKRASVKGRRVIRTGPVKAKGKPPGPAGPIAFSVSIECQHRQTLACKSNQFVDLDKHRFPNCNAYEVLVRPKDNKDSEIKCREYSTRIGGVCFLPAKEYSGGQSYELPIGDEPGSCSNYD